ncbi:MAG: GAF domain-containing sensor histidine kinase [Chloroflexota bacterium]
MNLSEYNAIIPLVTAGVYTLIFVFLFLRGIQSSSKQVRWLLAALAFSLGWEFSLFFTRLAEYPNLPISLLILSTACIFIVTAEYLDWKPNRRWYVLGILAIVSVILINFLEPQESFVISDVPIRVSQLLSLSTWIALHGLTLGFSILFYRQTKFPWHANRLLFWILSLFALFIGESLLLFNLLVPVVVGQTLRLLSFVGFVYALSSYRIFDVRTRSQKAYAFIIINTLSGLPLAAAIFVVQQYINELTSLQLAIIISAIVVFWFFFYQSFRNLIERITYRYILGEDVNTNKVVREYSQAISKTLDMQQLSILIVGTLSELLEINRGALMLVTQKEDNLYEIEPIPAMGRLSREPFSFRWDSVFIESLVKNHQPVLQYDLDFNPDFNSLSDESKLWLNEQAMEVYVSIKEGAQLVGLIAIGPKNTAVPYQPSELELVQILADQTVVALQNARLYGEMGDQNEKIRNLNNNLVEQNERLEIMDRVKSDFITIASHELRTPLTQVKGYTDILSAMNEENALTREQTREIVNHVNRATLQLEGLITAMLDASQLDVDGMQLTFVKTKIDTIIRLAIEPLAQASRERQISIGMQGVEELPSIQADFKRLVQTFTNIIGNAIKYTPDHGSIAIEARVIPSHEVDDDHIEIVISDSGIGIDSKFHELIFEKFFRIGDPQLHSTGSTKFKGAGPGLGLPIARGVIEAHGGQIWVESIGEDESILPGSKFYITLPVTPKGAFVNSNGDSNSQPSYLIG